jgi:hypothetical protein
LNEYLIPALPVDFQASGEMLPDCTLQTAAAPMIVLVVAEDVVLAIVASDLTALDYIP